MRADHPRTRPRWRNDVIAGLELGEHLARKRERRSAIARVVAGLAAARLRRRHHDLAAGSFEQFERCKAYARPHQVDQTSHEQTDSHYSEPVIATEITQTNECLPS